MRNWINLFETHIEETTDLHEERRKSKFVGTSQESFNDDGEVVNVKLPWANVGDFKTAEASAGEMTDEEFHKRAECKKKHEADHVYRDLGKGVLSASKDGVHNFYA